MTIIDYEERKKELRSAKKIAEIQLKRKKMRETQTVQREKTRQAKQEEPEQNENKYKFNKGYDWRDL